MSGEQLGGLFLGATAALLGPFVWWLTMRAAQGRLRRNLWVGMRTAKTLRNDHAWVVGHRAAAPWTRRTAWATVVAGLATAALALTGPAPASLTGGFLAIGVLLGGLFLAVLAAHREIDASGPPEPPGPV